MVKQIPPFHEFMLPILKFLKDNKEHKIKDILEAICVHFEFSDEQKKQLTPSRKQATIYNRCYWALFYLKKAEFVKSAQKSWFQITEKGLDNKDRERLSVKDLKNCSEAFSKFHNNNGNNYTEDEQLEIDLNTQNETPEEILYNAYQKIRDKLVDDLLEKIKDVSSEFFEKLVVDLLTKMGYGDGKVIGQPGDGGIDGIIKEDKLGLDKIYIQAKRWNDRKVGSQDIDGFIGALVRKGAKKGIFITSSDFTENATKYDPEIKIVLINGKELANLMIDYNLGVSLQQSYEIKRIDSDYFED